MYCTSVTGVIVLLCGIYHLNKCRKRILHSSKEHQVVPIIRNSGYIVMEEGLYDLIDETNMIENRINMNGANVNAYLEVVDTSIDTSSNSENSTEEKDDSANILNSYESLAKYVNVQENENYTSNSSCSTNEPENVQSENINNYCNLYQSLTGNRRLITYTYEKTAVYHVMKCQSIKYRTISSRSLTIKLNTKMDASSRRFSF